MTALSVSLCTANCHLTLKRSYSGQKAKQLSKNLQKGSVDTLSFLEPVYSGIVTKGSENLHSGIVQIHDPPVSVTVRALTASSHVS